MHQNEPIISLRNVERNSIRPKRPLTALDDIQSGYSAGRDFRNHRPSGAAKAHGAMHHMLETPTSGTGYLKRTSGCPEDRTKANGQTIHGHIFSNSTCWAQRNILKNVCFPLGIPAFPGRRTASGLWAFGTGPAGGSGRRFPAQLSEDRNTRVAIAPALANQSKVILCYEATTLWSQYTKSIAWLC